MAKKRFAELEGGYEAQLREIEELSSAPGEQIGRLRAELRFAAALAESRSEKESEWGELIEEALKMVRAGLEGGERLEELIGRAEGKLRPIGERAKDYTIHYVAHAHTDMNWLWDWPETVDTTVKTFSTMLELMEQFPDFRFSQSQAVTYHIAERYGAGLLDRIKGKVEAGNWEVTASTWVEGDKNMAAGETQFRQILYANKYLAEKMGLDPQELRLDWEPDTFGHPITTPEILSAAGIDYYYLHRPGGSPQPDYGQGKYGIRPRLFWWEGRDGSRVLAWNDEKLTYNNHVDPAEVVEVLLHEEETGMKDYMIVYGVGDHGGGPSREDLELIQQMNDWPVFPRTEFSGAQEYFDLAKEEGQDLPVVREELNFLFRGCYSSQNRIKYANRKMENDLPVAEAVSALSQQFNPDANYPDELLEEGWRMACFNQFHDILPGSGIGPTAEHAGGNFQETEAIASSVTEEGLRTLLSTVDTSGDGRAITVFNPTSQQRTEGVEAVLYGLEEEELEELAVFDEEGQQLPLQVLETPASARRKMERGEESFFERRESTQLAFDLGYGHSFAQLLFEAEEVPPFGYRTFWVRKGESLPNSALDVERIKGGFRMENERLRVEVEARSASLVGLYDKRAGKELVPGGERLGALTMETEEPHDMSAWVRGRVKERDSLLSGWSAELLEEGPVRATVRCERSLGDTELKMDISVYRLDTRLEFNLDLDWHESGDRTRGVPALVGSFPLNAADPQFFCDIPFGGLEREKDGKDVPAQDWASLEAPGGWGMTVTSDGSYGFAAEGNELRLTLLRGSYEPDPLPEVGRKGLRFALFPQLSGQSGVDRGLAGRAFHRPLLARPCKGEKGGELPSTDSLLEVKPSSVRVAALKREEKGEGLVLRLVETAGERTEVELEPGWEVARIEETDPLERGEGEKYDAEGKKIPPIAMEPFEIKTLKVLPA